MSTGKGRLFFLYFRQRAMLPSHDLRWYCYESHCAGPASRSGGESPYPSRPSRHWRGKNFVFPCDTALMSAELCAVFRPIGAVHRHDCLEMKGYYDP